MPDPVDLEAPGQPMELAFRDVFGDDPEWDGYIRWFVSRISS